MKTAPEQAVHEIDPLRMLRPRRRITGMSAVLLPFTASGDIDWEGLERQIIWSTKAGLWPAVNMDTGYVHLLDDATRGRILEIAQQAAGERPFAAGAFVSDRPDDVFCLDAYRRQIDAIVERGGTPVIFQSYGLTRGSCEEIVQRHAQLGESCASYIAFELGTMFAPFGAIYPLETYAAIMDVPQCIGAKHSSLNRIEEWRRLALRDERRPEFMVLTGNDWAIDMVMYGSDYLLGLSSFAPDLFARRDAMWLQGDPEFYELNDALQYLGHFAFREPVPGYRHSAARFLKIRGRIDCDEPHRLSPRRPDSDREILIEIASRLGKWMDP